MPYDLPSKEVFQRIIKTPDGTDYIIALPGWYWNSLDWMDTNTNWHEIDFIGIAWRVARQMENDGTMKHPGNLHAEFAFVFEAVIWAKMNDFISTDNGASNTNYYQF
jgi:hypothetical protein